MKTLKTFNFWYTLSDNVINGSVFCFGLFLLIFIWNPSIVGFQALMSVLNVGAMSWAASSLLREPAEEEANDERVRNYDQEFNKIQDEYEQSIMFPGRANRPGSKLR